MVEQDQQKKVITFRGGLKAMALEGPMNILLITAPFGLISWGLGWSPALTFVLSLLAICPLAERLGFITEQLALYTNETVSIRQ